MIAADMIPLPLHLQKGRFRADTEYGEGHTNTLDTRHDLTPCHMAVVM